MTGPEHYREAERLREKARESQVAAYDHHDNGTDPTRAWNNATYYLATAQVHATLALAAATIEAAGVEPGAQLILRPIAADAELGEPAFSGTPWGRALYGEARA